MSLHTWPHTRAAAPLRPLTESDLDAAIGQQAWPPRRAAAPGPVEIEPSEFPHALRQAADEQAQHRRWAFQPQVGSQEGCADVEDGEPRRQAIPEGGGLVVALVIVSVLAAVVIAAHWLAVAA